MQIVTNNPYRIVGIPANSTEKDILKQKTKIKRFSEVGKEISSEYDFSFLPALKRSNGIIDKAFSDIEQNQDKVVYSLFWFINLSSIDNTAIQHLISGNKEKASEIWEKLTDGKEVNSKNFSAFNNIGTLYLLDESKEKQKQGIGVKIKLIESDSFKNFVNVVADETYTIDANRQTEKFIDELLSQFKNKFSIAYTIDLFNDCNSITQKYLSQKFTEEPIHKIETQIELVKNKRIKDKGNALQFGTDLYKNTKEELKQLKSILGTTNLQYKMLADNIAKEILQCSIDYFNEWQETKDPSKECLYLIHVAQSLTTTSQTNDRIAENLKGMQEFAKNAIIKADLDAIIELLDGERRRREKEEEERKKERETNPYIGRRSFSLPNYRLYGEKIKINNIGTAKKLIENAIPHLLNIKSVLGGNDQTYLQLSTSVAAKAQNYIVATINNAQEPDNFGNISLSDLKEKIAKAWTVIQQIEALDMTCQFKENFDKNKKKLKDIFDQLKNNQIFKDEVVDCGLINCNYGKIPQLNFIIKGGEILNTDKKRNHLIVTNPLYNKFIRFIGLKLEIIGLRTQTIEFFLKYIIPTGYYKHSPQISPKGFTTSSKCNITTETKYIEVGGYGNSEECTYEIGEHRIEVWVENFKIYEKTFTVDLSPSQKIEKELEEANKVLAEIRQKTYLANEINFVKKEMDEIEKFKLFRGSAEKQRQVKSQQRKIDEVIKRSDIEKDKEIRLQEAKIDRLKLELLKAEY